MSPLVPNVSAADAVATIRVVIVDDEPLARDCMRLALRGVPGVTIVAECVDGASAVDVIRSHAPDVVLLDVQMPGLWRRAGAACTPAPTARLRRSMADASS